VDFAYNIHTQVGNQCVSARVNDQIRDLDTQLISGDIVEIITDKNRKSPDADWLKFVKTQHARGKIRDATRSKMKNWFSNVMHIKGKAVPKA